MQFELREKVMVCCCLFLDIYIGVGFPLSLTDFIIKLYKQFNGEDKCLHCFYCIFWLLLGISSRNSEKFCIVKSSYF
jgi:hypothetical protein